MDIINSFKDIIKHTNSLGCVDMVKLIGTDTDAKIEAIDTNKSVVIYGTMYQPINGINSTIGLSRIQILKGFIDFPLFADETAKNRVITEQRNNLDIPSELEFLSDADHKASYRFMSEAMVNEQIKVPPFKGALWNVTINPEKKHITELSYMQNTLGGIEKRFTVSVDSKQSLIFSIGSGPTDRTAIPFAKNVVGTLKHKWSWPLSQVLSILKLADTASSCTMSFSDQGVMKIEIDSGIGIYQYIVPAGKD